MKNHIIISLLILSVGLSQKEYDINHIVEQNNVYIKKFSDEIVNGKVFQMFGDMKVPLGKMKDGKKEGKWMVWYDNGTKQREQNYKDGKKNGLFTEWRENGIKRKDTQYLNDEKYGLETNYREEGGMYSQVDWTDRLHYRITNFYEDGTIYTSGYYSNKEPYDGQFMSNGKFEGDIFEIRKTRRTYEKGKLIMIEWYENLDTESRNVVRVDDCINTDDCLSGKEKKQKKETSTEKKTIYEQKPFRVSYITHNYGDDIEVEFILNNMGNKPYSSVWFNFSFYNGDKMVGKERISFLSLGVFSEEIEIIDFYDEFDNIKVELLKFKLK
jgi:antitoxin component YwqK of YwqJK toxin-antitoxin module